MKFVPKTNADDYSDSDTDGFDGVTTDKNCIYDKVVEKNKKIIVVGSAINGGDDVVEIRNLTSTTMTFYQEVVVNNVKYINYVDFKK